MAVAKKLLEAPNGNVPQTFSYMKQIQRTGHADKVIDFLDKVSGENDGNSARKGLGLVSVLGGKSKGKLDASALKVLDFVVGLDNPIEGMDMFRGITIDEGKQATVDLTKAMSSFENPDEALSFVKEHSQGYNLDTLVFLTKAKTDKAGALKELANEEKRLQKEGEDLAQGKKVIYKKDAAGLNPLRKGLSAVAGLGVTAGSYLHSKSLEKDVTAAGKKRFVSESIKQAGKESVREASAALFGGPQVDADAIGKELRGISDQLAVISELKESIKNL